MPDKLTPRWIRDAIISAIRQGLPEFGEAIEKARGDKTTNLIRQRPDSLFERLYVEFYSDSDRRKVALQLAISYFPECPIPSGPFGYDAPLTHIVEGLLRADLLKYWSGAGWYQVKASDESPEPFLQLFEEALLESVRPTLDDWGKQLLVDDVLRIAVGSYREIESERKSLEEAEEVFSRRLNKIGPASEQGYPISKIKLQLLTRLQGLKVWHMV